MGASGHTPPVSKLLVRSEQDGEREMLIEGDEFTIGRDPANHLCLAGDRLVSRFHARLFRQGTDWMVADEGSMNGTFIARTRLREPAVLNPGVKLRLGRSTIILLQETAPEPAAEPEDQLEATPESEALEDLLQEIPAEEAVPADTAAEAPTSETSGEGEPQLGTSLEAELGPPPLEPGSEVPTEAPPTAPSEPKTAEDDLFGTSWSLDEEETAEEQLAPDTETGGSDDMMGCTVCEAFPDHRGQHYNYRNLNMRLLGCVCGVRLPQRKNGSHSDCESARGYSHSRGRTSPQNPDAIGAGGLWFIEQSPEFEEVEAELRTADQQADLEEVETQEQEAPPESAEPGPALDDTLAALRKAAAERAAQTPIEEEELQEEPQLYEQELAPETSETLTTVPAAAPEVEAGPEVPVSEPPAQETVAAAQPPLPSEAAEPLQEQPLPVEESPPAEEPPVEAPAPEELPVQQAPSVEAPDATPSAISIHTPVERAPLTMDVKDFLAVTSESNLHHSGGVFWTSDGRGADLRPLSAQPADVLRV